MTASLGQTLILLSLLAATAGTLLAFAGASRRDARAWRWTERCIYLYAAALGAANAVMVTALLRPDFSVRYVTLVGSRSVPKWVAVVSLWSSLEGSLLFWGLVLGVFAAAATWANRARHPELMPWAAGVWMATATFFSFLLAGPARPFVNVPQPPLDGPGPNALLQNHVLMAVHPPFLYVGYVGMTIPFGLAAAALLAGRLGPSLLRTLRLWLLLPWTFLTIAIVLGGWWAYDVLGWGGYWAWDPVENASLLPWLTATAALHSALLVERKAVLKGLTVTLVMATFLLTILGTFMTRSGVFNSVHSFTQSAIGPTLLVFLIAAMLSAIVLLAKRIDLLAPEAHLEAGFTRDALLLLGNLALLLLAFTVLIGTTFPLFVAELTGRQMSVGSPYYERMAVPLGLALLILMGVGSALPWVKARGTALARATLGPLAGGVVAVALGWTMGARNGWTLLTLMFAGYAAQVAVRAVLRARLRRVAAQVIHLGATLIFVGVAVSSTMAVTKDVVLAKGESVTLGRYALTFKGVDIIREPHREALAARIVLAADGQPLATLTPRMNYYASQQTPVGTPAVRSTLWEDVYLSVTNVDASQETLGLHALVNPLVSWIWAGMIVMAVGGLMAMLPSRAPEQAGGGSEAVAPDRH